ncbi:two-component system, OmpR family, response regulator/two-component system, OmpR family, response regulator RegX3 [Alkalispirochaeta americana]|uniref:Two-component system, OmpR family, response regulator/two-component system, OmpR family, response regulator RegX3 n=1 Tax=Alkalispirochaeta americana TaxID=159291 RepID=A0A1N6NKI5_9SPIO|nr:response regulator transcription factor [Alkalispirochaeta americana]SIP92522.1 two-component system, OmpR family, response regulator/two-component system, OmpR family, response regulator RegX3 [Alkalispirochaeta americana]
MTGSILIVEDDADIAQLMSAYLHREGFSTEIAGTGEAAIAALKSHPRDLILLDINLPGIDGFEVLQNLRRTGDTPVIIMTARREDMDVVFGLGAGADEYVTKPFSPRVLVARVRALLRRVQVEQRGSVSLSKEGTQSLPPEGEAGAIRLGAVSVHLETSQVIKEGTEISLAPREFALLRYLIQRKGRPAGPREIYEAVWGNDYGDLSSVAVHIQRLRRKLEEDPADPQYIITRHGYGYVLLCSPPASTRETAP